VPKESFALRPLRRMVHERKAFAAKRLESASRKVYKETNAIMKLEKLENTSLVALHISSIHGKKFLVR